MPPRDHARASHHRQFQHRQHFLVERDTELAAIRSAIGNARSGGGSSLIIEGAAGSGKTSLLDRALDSAADMHVLTGTGREHECGFPFSLAMQLFERLEPARSPGASTDNIFADVPDAAVSLFSAGAVTLDGSASGEATLGNIVHGAWVMLLNLTQQAPTIIVVDDLQWADTHSLRLLNYLIERIDQTPILLMAAHRPEPAQRGTQAELVRVVARHPRAQALHLTPLSLEGVQNVVENTLHGDVEPAFSEALYHAAGGNPFLTHAMLRQIDERDEQPSTTQIEAARPRDVHANIADRIRRLGDDAQRFTEAAIVLGSETAFTHVAALAQLDSDAATRVADELVAAEILATTDPVSVEHPIVAGIVYDGLPPAKRSNLHWRAACVLHDVHAPAERVAAQLVSAPLHEPWATDVLLTAAERAQALGDPAMFITLSEKALDAIADSTRRASIHIDIANAKRSQGDDGADADIQRALELSDDRAITARAWQVRGSLRYLRGDYAEAERAFATAISALADADEEVAHDLHAGYFSVASMVPGKLEAAQQYVAPLVARTPGHESPAERVALAGLAAHLALSGGSHAEAVALALRAWGDGRMLLEAGPSGWGWSLVSGALTWCGAPQQSLEILERVIEAADRTGAKMSRATASFCILGPLHQIGRLADARDAGEHALAAMHDGWNLFPLGLKASYANLLYDLDEPDTGLMLLRTLDAGQAMMPPGGAAAFNARGQLHLAAHQLEQALDDFAVCERVCLLTGFELFAMMPWRIGTANVAFQLGDTARAAQLLDDAAAVAARTGSIRHMAAVLRTRAQFVSPREAHSLLDEAMDLLASSPFVMDRLACDAQFGAVLRRENNRREAKTRLQTTLEQAREIGARRLIRELESELHILGARPRRRSFSGVDALTASERRVVDLAASGATNREIATALSVSARTVERHLYLAYRKLGITSRRQLAALLAAVDSPPA